MKKVLSMIAAATLVASMAFAGAPGSAPGTLYMQEGTSADGPEGIIATGHAPGGVDANLGNWIWQSGAGSWSGVYAPPSAGDGGTSAWLSASQSGDSNLQVEADIEMFCATSMANNKIYFHLGNITTAGAAELTAFVNGTLVSNNGQYVGLNFSGTGKTAANFEMSGTAYTGKILGAMVSDRDTFRVQNNAMDIRVTMSDGIGAYTVPVNYGDGSHNTQHDTLFWAPIGPGSFNLTWKVELLPTTYQPDGDYHLDPQVVCAPVM